MTNAKTEQCRKNIKCERGYLTDTAASSSSFCLWTCRTRLNTDGLKGAGDTHQTELTEFKPVKIVHVVRKKEECLWESAGYLFTTLATVLSLTAASSSSGGDGSGKKRKGL